MSVVYFMRAGKDGPIKIGRAKDEAVRLKNLQTGHHTQLELVRTIPNAPLELEKLFHVHFRHRRIRGEWFEFDGDMLTVTDPQKPIKVRPQKGQALLFEVGGMTPDELRQLRLDRRLTQAELGALLGVTARAVSAWEAGATPIHRIVELAIERLFELAPHHSNHGMSR
jgi:DNA-binding XRE family transcriptional regulator